MNQLARAAPSRPARPRQPRPPRLPHAPRLLRPPCQPRPPRLPHAPCLPRAPRQPRMPRQLQPPQPHRIQQHPLRSGSPPPRLLRLRPHLTQACLVNGYKIEPTGLRIEPTALPRSPILVAYTFGSRFRSRPPGSGRFHPQASVMGLPTSVAVPLVLKYATVGPASKLALYVVAHRPWPTMSLSVAGLPLLAYREANSPAPESVQFIVQEAHLG